MDTYSQFENLYKQYYQALVNFAMNMVNDSDAAKDIVQEVFVRLWNRREEIEFGPYIKNYLFKAVTNTSLDHLRFCRISFLELRKSQTTFSIRLIMKGMIDKSNT